MSMGQITNRSDEIAEILKTLGHSKRLLILCSLIEGPKSVGELVEIIGIAQPQTSQFLKRMELEGLLESVKEGNYSIYSISDERLSKLLKQIKKIYC